jgi:hypothetical protein
MKLRVCALPMMAVALWAAPAATVAGKWTGTINVHDAGSGADIPTPVSVEFAVSATGAITGNIGREAEPSVSIQKAKVAGDLLTFEAANEETTGPMVFTLHIAGDQLSGEMKGSIDVQPITAKVTLTRQH